MVDSVAATVDAVIANGGEIVQPIEADAPEVTARFRDPAGVESKESTDDVHDGQTAHDEHDEPRIA